MMKTGHKPQSEKNTFNFKPDQFMGRNLLLMGAGIAQTV
jgi:hypothetical protein